jgi:hypothetical protein
MQAVEQSGVFGDVGSEEGLGRRRVKPPRPMEKRRHDPHDQRLEDEHAAADDAHGHLHGGPHERETRVVGEIDGTVGGGHIARRIHNSLVLQSGLEVGDTDDVDDGDEPSDDECRDEYDLLPELHAERGEDREGEKENGQIGEDVDRRRGEVERDNVDAGAVDVCECRGDGPTLEDVEKGQHNAGHGDEGGVAEERVRGGHPPVQDENGRLGGHEGGVVEDGEGVDGSFQGHLP